MCTGKLLRHILPMLYQRGLNAPLVVRLPSHRHALPVLRLEQLDECDSPNRQTLDLRLNDDFVAEFADSLRHHQRVI